jgi:hypothetical protein
VATSGIEDVRAHQEVVEVELGRVLSVQEMTARLAAVDAAAIRRFAARLCERGEPAMAAVGPITRLESHDRFARRFGREHALAGA